MDPLIALGLVANIVPFIEIAAKVSKPAKEIHDSESGGLNDNINLEKYATQLNQHYSNLLAPDFPDLIGDDKELCILAAECQKLADDLLDVLERIKPADRSSKWQSLKSAAKNLWRATDKEMLEKRLELCRSQIEAQLNQRLSTNMNVALRRLLDATEKDTEKLKQVESYVENLRQGVQVTSLCKEARDQLSRLISIPEDAIHQTALESFLSGITFDGIHERFEMVASGYGYKFDWIKDDLYRSQENDFNWYPRKSLTTLHLEFESRNDRYVRRSKELFSNWLWFGRDIFHISAKLGAGKSTLIKNLCTNDEVNNRLSDWAGDKKLATGKFFFWNSGTRLQKSLAGLSRALLCDVLRSAPELLSSAFGSRWNEALAIPWQTKRTLVITDQECIDALERLIIRSHDATSSYRFCFFIDGLDELQETPHFSFRDLSQVIKRWARNSGGNVKLCVSSREYNEFMDEFDDIARVRLHNLTKIDMMSYVQNKLRKASDTKQIESTASLIVGKAQGVFLWVALVVRDLSEKLHDGFCLEDLTEQIHSLPDELDSFFDLILKSIRQETPEVYKLFSIMIESSQWQLPLDTVAFSFLGPYEKDPRPDFFLKHKPESIRHFDCPARGESCKRKLVRRSKGLIEGTRDPRAYFTRFQCTHRSIQEFLLKPKIKAKIEEFLSQFNTKEALSQITCFTQRAYGLHNRQDWVRQLLAMREAGQMDQEPWIFLSSLNDLLSRHCSLFPKAVKKMRGERPDTQFIDPGELYSISPVSHLAYEGHLEFPLWWLRQTPIAGKFQEQALLLVYCALFSQVRFRQDDQKANTRALDYQVGLQIVKTALERGLITPDSVMELTCYGRFTFGPSCWGGAIDTRGSLTLLEMVFLTALLCKIQGEANLKWAGDVLEELLIHEAGLDFNVSLGGRPFECELTIKAGDNYVWEIWHALRSHKTNLGSFSNLTPCDIIKKCDFHNKERLLELLNGQMNRYRQNDQAKSALATSYKSWARSTTSHLIFGAFLGSLMVIIIQELWGWLLREGDSVSTTG